MTSPTQSAERPALAWRSVALAALVLAAALVLVFGDLMVAGDSRVVSKVGCDVFSGALGAKEYYFHQLRQGHFTLWCPAVLGGSPSFGGFQSGLVYPPSLPYLLLPAAAAVNWSFILHAFLGGMFMYLWLGRRGLHRYACLVGALMFAFCAPFYLRLYAGHVMPHSTIAWIPLVFLAIDGLIESPGLGWLLLGAAAVSLELLGGYPQVLFYTAIAAAAYTLARLPESPRRWKSLLLLGLMNLLALGLGCVQWAAGLAMSGECVRQGGVPYEFAAMFSFPPENWLTLLRPGLFGDMEHFPYWGRCYLWEMCAFFGTTGLFFAAAGLWAKPRRRVLLAAGLVVLLGVLALGAHSPHFRFFYEHVPGFNVFRGNSKFVILAVVFLIFLSAHGFDLLFRGGIRLGWLCAGATASVAAVGLLFVLLPGSSGNFAAFVNIPAGSGETAFDPALLRQPANASAAASFMSGELLAALLFLAGLALVLALAWRRPEWRVKAGLAAVALLGAELLLFAWQTRASFPAAAVRDPALEKFLKANLGDARVFSPDGSNIALTMDGVCDMWGYGSDSVIRRYAEFLAFTQGDNPDQVTGYQVFRRMHPRFDLLRCKYILASGPDGRRQVAEAPAPLPRFLLVRDWRVAEKRDDVFAAISEPTFDPRGTVLLERAPAGWTPPPAGAAPSAEADAGTVRLLRETTDWQEVAMTLSKPAVLLETDLYTPNWHVRALPGSAQDSYELIPADYILRGIPLAAGEHRLRIEYRPRAFVVGAWVSAGSLLLFLGLAGVWWRGRRRVAGGKGDCPRVR